jgi:hypothetical protein
MTEFSKLFLMNVLGIHKGRPTQLRLAGYPAGTTPGTGRQYKSVYDMHPLRQAPGRLVGLPRRGVRVSRQFAWLEVGSVKIMLPRPARLSSHRGTLADSLF